jgi:glutathione synthase/RimK-type ligase-like ATP-grasp enzyme
VPRVLLATSAGPRIREHADDALLLAALEARSVVASIVAWSDPAVRWSDADACVLRSTWDYHEQPAAFLDWVRDAARATRLWNPPGVVAWNAHKRYLLDLAARGVPIVPTRRLPAGGPVDLAAILAEEEWVDFVLKPAVGASSAGVARGSARELAAARAHAERLLREGDALLQPFVRSVAEEGEISVMFAGGRPTHAVRKVPRPGDHRANPALGARVERVTARPDTLAVAIAAVEAAPGPQLYARADVVRCGDGSPALMELELIEPLLFLREAPEAAEALADALLDELAAQAPRP